jgi:amino-acid N-acetyltransferase
MSTAAENIIRKFGGAASLAAKLGLAPSSVHRWTYPQSKGGTGGRVPSSQQVRLLELARQDGVDISPDDFFASQDGEAA